MLSQPGIASEPAEHEEWKGAGGEFGSQADWRQAFLASDGFGGQSLRGGAYLTDEKQAGVRDILRKRASKEKKVFCSAQSVAGLRNFAAKAGDSVLDASWYQIYRGTIARRFPCLGFYVE